MATNLVFSDTQFMTAAEKRSVARQWERFLKHLALHGYAGQDGFTLFPKGLYNHLHMHCGYIAHFDRHGFYCTYFTDPADCLVFIAPWVDGDNLREMMPEYLDIGERMVSVARCTGEAIMTKAKTAVRSQDIVLAHQLLAKHGVDVAEVRHG